LGMVFDKLLVRLLTLSIVCYGVKFFKQKTKEAESQEKEKKAILNDLADAILTLKGNRQGFLNHAAEALLESIREEEENVLDHKVFEISGNRERYSLKDLKDLEDDVIKNNNFIYTKGGVRKYFEFKLRTI
jgi:signal transduction histidine kinase